MVVREDTILNKVFCKYNLHDSTELILYDYNRQVGDSVFSYNVLFKDTFLHKVISVDTVLVKGHLYKIWHYSAVTGVYMIHQFFPVDYNVIEGIGCIEGLFFPTSAGQFEANARVVCFSNKGDTVFVPPYLTSGTCAKVSVENLALEKKQITIAPNPANESSQIILPYAMQGRLVVTNAMGQVVFQKEFQNKEQIELGALPAEGLYFYSVTDTRNSKTFTRKFVYE